RTAGDDRRRSLRLEAEELRPALSVFAEPLPPRGDVARISDGDRERVGCRAKVVADLEGGSLLTLDAVWVDRVDELDRLALDELFHDLERLVEVAPQRDDPGSMDHGLRELPLRDLSLRHDHGAAQACTRRIRRRARRGVAGRGADDGLGSARFGLRDGESHAAV